MSSKRVKIEGSRIPGKVWVASSSPSRNARREVPLHPDRLGCHEPHLVAPVQHPVRDDSRAWPGEGRPWRPRRPPFRRRRAGARTPRAGSRGTGTRASTEKAIEFRSSQWRSMGRLVVSDLGHRHGAHRAGATTRAADGVVVEGRPRSGVDPSTVGVGPPIQPPGDALQERGRGRRPCSPSTARARTRSARRSARASLAQAPGSAPPERVRRGRRRRIPGSRTGSRPPPARRASPPLRPAAPPGRRSTGRRWTTRGTARPGARSARPGPRRAPAASA